MINEVSGGGALRQVLRAKRGLWGTTGLMHRINWSVVVQHKRSTVGRCLLGNCSTGIKCISTGMARIACNIIINKNNLNNKRVVVVLEPRSLIEWVVPLVVSNKQVAASCKHLVSTVLPPLAQREGRAMRRM
jgi:hypothetical protein